MQRKFLMGFVPDVRFNNAAEFVDWEAQAVVIEIEMPTSYRFSVESQD